MPASPTLESVIRQPFAEQIEFFRKKLNLPTERWDDILGAAHDRAFVVAGAAKADLLNDLRQAVEKGTADGTTLAEFRKDFRAAVDKHGWKGWTGEDTKSGEAWRTRVIFETNLRTSYAAGRYAQLTDPDLLKVRPYWRYVHSDIALRPRPHHKAWGDSGLTLRHDDPFWSTHFPPNGWGCRCRITAVRAPRENDATAPPAGWDAADAKGNLPGIDKGWAYAPGASWHPDLDKYPYELASAMVAAALVDGVFERWVAHLAARTQDVLRDPDIAALPKAQQIEALRARLAGGEAYPVAVLPPELMTLLGVQTQTVKLSDYDLIKQQVSRAGQGFDAAQYLHAQLALASPRLLVRENDQMTLFVSDAQGEWYVAVLQQTKSGKGVYLKSYRRSNAKDARLQRKKGEVLIDTLPD